MNLAIETLVQDQFDAYNARDIERFMIYWASDCQYFAFPDQLLAEGAEAIRERHVERFKEPNLHGRLVNRISMGDLVIDREVVSRIFPEGADEIDVAMCEIRNSKIAKAWFKMGERRLNQD